MNFVNRKDVLYCLELALQGNDEANMRMMFVLNRSDTPERKAIQVEVVRRIQIAAQNKNPHALNLMGRIFRDGLIVKEDRLKAIQHFSAASTIDPASGYFYLAGMYGKDATAKKFEYMQKAANAGNSNACIELGEMLMEGEGTTKNHSLALKYFIKALELGDDGDRRVWDHLEKLYKVGVFKPLEVELPIDSIYLSEELSVELAQCVFEIVQKNPGITSIDISPCGECGEGLQVLAKSLAYNHTVQHIDLSYSGTSDDSVEDDNRAIISAELIQLNRNISSINLSGLGISSSGLRPLIKSLEINTTVQCDLRGIEMDAETIQAIENLNGFSQPPRIWIDRDQAKGYCFE